MQAIEIYSDSSRGVYIPRHFAESIRREYISGIDLALLDDLLLDPYGEDSELLWESWTRVLDNTILTCPSTGEKSCLYQDGDLFVVPLDQLESWLEGNEQ